MVTIFSLDSIPKLQLSTCWTQGASKELLPTFLSQNPPSTSTAGLDGWVWVRSGREYQSTVPKTLDQLDADSQSRETLAQAERDLLALKEDKTRAKKGEKTKKEKIDEVTQTFIDRMRGIGQSSHLTCGKWLFFEDKENVDSVFGVLARSIIDGPLSKLKVCCHTVKAANAIDDKPGGRVICLYFDDVWNEDNAKEVLICLLRHHNMNPSACKPDLYTAIDLSSGRPSGIRASIFTSALVPEPEKKKLRGQAEKEFGLDSKGRKIIKAAENKKTINEDDYDDTESEDEADADNSNSNSKSSSKASNKKPQRIDSDTSEEEETEPKAWKYVPKSSRSRSKKSGDSSSKGHKSNSKDKAEAQKPKSSLVRELAEMNDDSSEDEGIKRGNKQLKGKGDSSASDNATKIQRGSGAVGGKKGNRRSASMTEDSVTEDE